MTTFTTATGGVLIEKDYEVPSTVTLRNTTLLNPVNGIATSAAPLVDNIGVYETTGVDGSTITPVGHLSTIDIRPSKPNKVVEVVKTTMDDVIVFQLNDS